LVNDSPGALNKLTSVLQQAEANVLQVYHKRDVPFLHLDQSIVEVTLESKGEVHCDNIFNMVKEEFYILPRA
jgi:threonine dehydratase